MAGATLSRLEGAAWRRATEIGWAGGFELLSQGLRPMVDETFASIAPGMDWPTAVGQVMGRPMAAHDVHTYLVLLTQKFAELLKDRLPYSARTYANELRDYRNDWALMKPFTVDDALRALGHC